MEETKSISNNHSFEHLFAKIISLLLHPLLMPTYSFALILYTENYISTFTPKNSRLIFIGIIFIFTFLLPTINALILLKMKRISSLEMEDPKERVVPYFSTAIYFFALYYLFYKNAFSNIFTLLILGAGISILLTLFINFKWKISAHAIGIGGVVGAIMGISLRLLIDLNLILFISIFLSGLAGYARLKLKAHTPSQVYTGFLVGFLVELILMVFF